ncbi:restriction endonuclease [Celeribacter neptunius]|uniref:Restriction system protein n=1 Tax=Celeribacter neptunius TaxID=588602 RepID=A0A1I3VDF7_9RHOB|nr:restriction endonuclease [Celeribacter neptunius]SFJ93023.1 restriction system protein [Celeribacter neptunius]
MLGLGLSIGNVVLHQRPAQVREQMETLSHELIIPIQLLEVVEHANEGQIIAALRYPWEAIFQQVKTSPEILYQFSKHPREFEEFIASTYDRLGYKVTLTPRSGDGGKDLIAEKSGFGKLRILDQCKAFSKGNTVGMNDVRAMMGTFKLNTDFDNTPTRAVITTTSTFAPTAKVEWKNYIPSQLELRDHDDLVSWLSNSK